MTVLWVTTTWVTFPPAGGGMGLATATWPTWPPVSAIKMRGMPLTATPMAMPVSSARRLPGLAGGVGGLPARRASTRAAISLSTFSRERCHNRAAVLGAKLTVHLGGGADVLRGQR